MAELHVEIVAVERELWSGDATFVFTRTTAGEIGILPRHIPLVAQLVDDAMVRVEREGEDDLRIGAIEARTAVEEARGGVRRRRHRPGSRHGVAQRIAEQPQAAILGILAEPVDQVVVQEQCAMLEQVFAEIGRAHV